MEREAFLDNLAARLGRPRLAMPPRRDVEGVPSSYASAPFGAVVPQKEWPERFKSELEALGGEAIIASSAADASAALRETIGRLRGPSGIMTWGRDEFDGWPIQWLWDDECAFPFCAQSNTAAADITALRERARDADIGVTTADFAIANTGTLLIYTSPTKARSVSLLPKHHVALIRESQMVARIGDALPGFAFEDGRPPSSLHFITGPSRSADIENDLTIGVHGPATVTVIVWRDKVGD